MPAVEKHSEIINDVLVVHVTGKVIPLHGLMTLLKRTDGVSGVLLNNKVPDYIPDRQSIAHLLGLIEGLLPEQKKLAIIPFTSLQKAMFEIVFDEFSSIPVDINFFEGVSPAISWLRQSAA